MEENIDNKFNNLEAKILEQEHRLFRIWVNFFTRNKYNRGDKRRNSINKAVIWSLIPKPTPTLIAISTISILTAYLAYEANVKLENQNTLLLIQNELQESQRRSSLNIEISSIMQQINNERESSRLKSLKDSLHKKRGHKVSPYILSDITSARIASISRSLRPYRILKTDRIDIEKFNTKGLFSKNFSILKTKTIRVNDFLENDVRSPEREQLLAALFTMRISFSNIGKYSNFDYCFFENINFSKGDLRTIRLSNSSLKQCNIGYTIFDNGQFNKTNFSSTYGTTSSFISSDLEYSTFINAFINNANFSYANLSNTNFQGANLIQCKFDNAIIDNTDFSYADLSGVDFTNMQNIHNTKLFKNTLVDNIHNCPDSTLQFMLKNGALIDPKKYNLELERWKNKLSAEND
ncbi:pentapeptide repeat-containing protein [uncultured Tenacibaculum sp.]|uniref:pentapeptide repeat-containing protein n=1 Tax=uncultured Tenacibaculum sp. TaxID=174713 RepID=UPI00260810BB|nr:pentapeptide repeat-containing protein [uncultured Tenacibaculum sp.]